MQCEVQQEPAFPVVRTLEPQEQYVRAFQAVHCSWLQQVQCGEQKELPEQQEQWELQVPCWFLPASEQRASGKE